MPELPEVEVVRRSLEPHLIGDLVSRVEVREERLRERIDTGRLNRYLLGERIERVRRRAKYLLLDLTGDHTLVVHLGMSGRLALADAGSPARVHEHLSVGFRSGTSLRFRDPRRFGLVLVLRTDSIDADRRFRHLGAEPLEESFDGDLLRRLAAGRRGPVKSFLMNGTLLAGVGNIYASEALFLAGIHPRRSVARIGRSRWLLLGEAVQEVLRRAIDQGGTTLNDFRDAVGGEGYFQVSLAVYGRAGEPCGRCDGTIRRIVQSGRSTFYCPGCQR